jgi:Uma2 family endonuclease
VNLIPHDLPEADIHTENGCEWIDGRIVEKAMGMESSFVSLNLASHLRAHVVAGALGFVFPGDLGYQINVGSSRRVRKPDVSFIASARLEGGRILRGNCRIAPDLAVEVISPNDEAEEIEQRVADFMSVGTRLFWIVYPATRSVWVLRADGSAQRLTAQQNLSGEDVVPGFSCPIESLFAGTEAPSTEG